MESERISNVPNNLNASADVAEEQFEDFLANLRAHYNETITGGRHVFTTTASGLYDLLLDSLPAERRQHYSCMACRRFVEKYGGLVVIETSGEQTPIMWSPVTAPPFFGLAVSKLYNRVKDAKVNGVFLAKEAVWGLPQNKDRVRGLTWTHMSVTPPKAFSHALKEPNEIIAARAADYQMVRRILNEYPADTMRETLKILRGGLLFNADSHAAMAAWFVGLHDNVAQTRDARTRDNLLWLAVASAPAGYANARGGMLGALLDDVKAGLPFETIKNRWNEKADPIRYRRTQAPPTAGNVQRAEEIVEKLGIKNSLRRRYAKMEDVQAGVVWRPIAPITEEKTEGGVFGHLKTKNARPEQKEINTPYTRITLDKFLRTVLPEARSMEIVIDSSKQDFSPLVTAADPESPIITNYGNPVSWYVRRGGSYPHEWGLQGGTNVAVKAIVRSPSMWNDPSKRAYDAFFFLLEGARPPAKNDGGGMFTVLLKSDFHEIRSTLEAYFNGAEIEGAAEGDAVGIRIGAESGSDVKLRVHVETPVGEMRYLIDRWD